jgi:hypothetical protein
MNHTYEPKVDSDISEVLPLRCFWTAAATFDRMKLATDTRNDSYPVQFRQFSSKHFNTCWEYCDGTSNFAQNCVSTSEACEESPREETTTKCRPRSPALGISYISSQPVARSSFQQLLYMGSLFSSILLMSLNENAAV